MILKRYVAYIIQLNSIFGDDEMTTTYYYCSNKDLRKAADSIIYDLEQLK